MIFIGVTGGIGSGKSLVCSQLEKIGIPVFYADEIAKQVPRKYPEIIHLVTNEFGEGAADQSTGALNSKIIAQIAFTNPLKLQKLNSIIHPFVFKELEEWKRKVSFLGKYGIIEAALIFESQMDAMVDYVLGVNADEQVRIQRVQERDRLSEGQIKSRMRYQISAEELEQRSDFLILNNGTIPELFATVTFYHTLFLTLQKRVEES